MEKKQQWLLTTTLFISLGLAACGSQSVLSQAEAQQPRLVDLTKLK